MSSSNSFICTYTLVFHDSFIRAPWLIHICTVTYSCLRPWLICTISTTMTHMHHDSFIRAPWRIHICTVTHSCLVLRLILFWPWLIHTCTMTHSYLYCHLLMSRLYDSVFAAPWLIHICIMTHMHYDPFIRAPWRIHICTVTHSCLVLRLILFCAMTHSYTHLTQAPVCHDSLIPATWRFHMCTIIHSCLVLLWILFCAICTIGSFIYAPWLMHIWAALDKSGFQCRGSFIFAASHIHICTATHSSVVSPTESCLRRDSLIYAPWRIHICALCVLTYSDILECALCVLTQKRRYAAKETYNFKESTNRNYPICAAWQIQECTHSYLCTVRLDILECVMPHI